MVRWREGTLEKVSRFLFDLWVYAFLPFSPRLRNLKSNKVEEYQCRYGRMKNFRCEIKLRVVYPQNNFKVIVEQSKGSHKHKPLSQPKLLEEDKLLMRSESAYTPLILQGRIQVFFRFFLSFR